MKQIWKSYKALPERLRFFISTSFKAALTIAAFYVLLSHKIDDGQGGRTTVLAAMRGDIVRIDGSTFIIFVCLATVTKLFGVLCSMFRWHILLIGQGIRFNFRHVAGAFLIGRFIGTFLPSTIGLDAYKLYDAIRFSKRVAEPTTATVIEKVLGQSGLLLTFLVSLPLGFHILVDSFGEQARGVVTIAVPIALFIVVAMFSALLWPGIIEWFLQRIPVFGRKRIQHAARRVSRAATAYRGKVGTLSAAMALSFGVHFTTAATYFFTALAVGAMMAEFWPVVLGSSIQIFATVIAPSIGGEGVRELTHLYMLKTHLGPTAAVMSATLGFLVAEAPTIPPGVIFWLARKGDYRPRIIELSEDLQSLDEPAESEAVPPPNSTAA